MGVVSCGTTMLDQGVFENIGAVTWDTTVKTSGFTAVSGNGYFCNTTSAAFTVTLPSSPSAGDIVGIKDYANTADTNNITIGRNGSNIQGEAVDFKISIEGGSVLLVYIDGTQGWKVTSSSQASDIVNPEFITATGGTITTSGDYKIHAFTGPGTFTVCSVGNPDGSTTVDYLVIAGGGGGGGDGGGAGGAGGYRINYPNPATGGTPVAATGYPVVIGAGGGGSACVGTSGSPSSVLSITSAGGGAGGGGNSTPDKVGRSGGSGGGGGARGGGPGIGNTPPVSPPQGNNGGAGSPPAPGDNGAGGGGSGNVGPAPANGGPGTSSDITGSSIDRAGGGGGGGGPSPAGSSGGGGATAGTPNGGANASNATANTGSGAGGGGMSARTGGTGGSGIVIIRYKFQ
jgi:hypothetical protein